MQCSMEPPSARMGSSLSASEDGRRLWLFGGNAGGGSLNDLYCLELETRTWSQVSMPCTHIHIICRATLSCNLAMHNCF